MQYSWYETGNWNSFLVCRISEGKWISCVEFQVFDIQKPGSCVLLTGFSFFFSSFFFLLLSTQFRELAALRKKLAQKHVSSKIFLAFLLCTSGTGVYSRHFLATVRNEKILAKGKWKVAAPVEKNLRKWFLRRKWANEEKRGDEYVEVLWKRGSVYGGDRFGVDDCVDCIVSSCLPFIFLPPAFYTSHITSFLTDVFCKLASFLLLWCQKE